MKKLLKIKITCWVVSLTALAIILFVTRGKPVISLDVDSFERGKIIVFEAEYADCSKMSEKEAHRIMKEKERHTIIFSEDDGKDKSDYSFGPRRQGIFGP